MKILVAAVQYNSRLLDKGHNLAQLVRWTELAARAGAKLIVLPEMGTTGYYFSSRDEVAALAEVVPQGETVQTLIQLAKRLECYIVAGLPERDGASLYNTCVLVGPEGYWGRYRKIHPYTPDTMWAKNGDLPIEVYHTPIGSLAMQICMDISFPEAVRVAKLKGAQVVCVPTNWYESVMPSSIWQTRAYENQVAMVVSNRWGEEKGFAFSGNSTILNQQGDFLATKATGDGFCLAEISTEVEMEPALPARRPELYGTLQLNKYHWPHNALHTGFATPRMPQGGTLYCGAAQFVPERGELEKNLAQIELMIGQAAERKVEFLAFPELALCGRPTGRDQAAALAIPAEHPCLDQVCRLAREREMDIVVGFVQEEQGKYYNAALWVGASGSRELYRKSHLTEEEHVWAEQGDQPGLWRDIRGSRVGILLGAELLVTELPRILANDGCDLIAVPAELEKCAMPYSGTTCTKAHWHIGRVRANENSTFVLMANACGYSGIFNADMFVDPFEEVIAEQREELVCMQIDTRPHVHNAETGYSMANPVRDKLMLSTRQTYWYEALYQNKAE